MYELIVYVARLSAKRLRNRVLQSWGRGGMLFLLGTTAFPGCAIHYYNTRTGVEHLIGIGHMKMKVTPPTEDVVAVVGGTETLGIGAGTTTGSTEVSLGWNRTTRLSIVDQDASLRLEWPTASFFNVRVGTRPPLLEQDEVVVGKNNKSDKGNGYERPALIEHNATHHDADGLRRRIQPRVIRHTFQSGDRPRHRAPYQRGLRVP